MASKDKKPLSGKLEPVIQKSSKVCSSYYGIYIPDDIKQQLDVKGKLNLIFKTRIVSANW